MPRKQTTEKTKKRSLEAKGFYSDCNKDETLCAVLIRSPAATGKVRNITIPELPEGYFLFTAKDIPGLKKIEVNNQSWKIFGYDNVSYSGEPLGILCGPDENKVLELLETVSVNFDIESLETALKKAIKLQKKPVVKISEKDNDLNSFLDEINELPSLDTIVDNKHIEQNIEETVAIREVKTGLFKTLPKEEAEKALFEETEDFVTSETWSLKHLPPNWKETCGAFCYKDGKSVHIYAPTKWTKLLMKTAAATLDIPFENIYVHKTKTSGVFSKGMWRTSVLSTQVALASYLTGKPVKLILTQSEQDSYMAPGVKTSVTYQTAISSTGVLNAVSVYIDVDVGCFNPFAQEITDRLAIAACNYYSPQNVHITAKAHTSKNPPTSICIKGIDSQILFGIENHLQKLSNLTNLFPDEIRRINLNKSKSDYPFVFNNENALNTFTEAIRISDFNRKYASFHMDAVDRVQENSNPFFALPLRGIGIATAFNVSNYYGSSCFSYNDKVEVTLAANEKLTIHTTLPTQQIQEIWKQTASDILQIKKDNITVDSEYNLEDLPDSPEDTLNSISTVNELIKKCCADIQKKRFHQPLPISVKKALPTTQRKNWNKENFCGNPFGPSSFATAVIEVELDTYTYNEKIKGLWLSVDCGELYDKAAALRAIKLEIQQQLEMLVNGKTVPCDNITITFVPSKNKAGQIGELVRNTVPAAFSSALSLALATQLTKIPCTEKQLFELIKQRETRIETETTEGEQE